MPECNVLLLLCVLNTLGLMEGNGFLDGFYLIQCRVKIEGKVCSAPRSLKKTVCKHSAGAPACPPPPGLWSCSGDWQAGWRNEELVCRGTPTTGV